MSADLVRLVGYGLVVPHGPVCEIEAPNRITCNDAGTITVFNADVIIFATGYRYRRCSQNFLPPEIREAPRWKHLFPVDRTDVAFVGFVRPYLTSTEGVGRPLPSNHSNAHRNAITRRGAGVRGSSIGSLPPRAR